MMGDIVYALCAATCFVCAVLLGRAWVRSRARVLLWSTICFALLFVNNVITFIDFVVLPDSNLHLLRSSFGFAAGLVLALGLVWESR